MACEWNIYSWIIPLLAASNLMNIIPLVHGIPKVPCYFIFGDSLVDVGNNNNLLTAVKVNFPPYGIDFPRGPTGRFCNGRTAADFIGQFMGFDILIPPFATARELEVLRGVNYASGAAGILDQTGKVAGQNIDLNHQLQNHQTITLQISDIMGNKDAATEYLNKCVYLFMIGANDYINNYFVPLFYNTSSTYTPEQYADILIAQYEMQIKALYNMGARKVAMSEVPPVGCTPNAIYGHDTNGSTCVDSMNDAVIHFNDRLKSMVKKLNNELTDAKFVKLAVYNLISYAVAILSGLGFKIASCCRTNMFTGLCNIFEPPCSIRNWYLFWDNYHPTEFQNRLIGLIQYLTLRFALL